MFGESYGKTSGQSAKGEIIRGFDQEPNEKFKTVAQGSFQNQRELLAKMRATGNVSPLFGVRKFNGLLKFPYSNRSNMQTGVSLLPETSPAIRLRS